MAATTLPTADQFLELSEEFDQDGNVVHPELIIGKLVRLPFSAPVAAFVELT